MSDIMILTHFHGQKMVLSLILIVWRCAGIELTKCLARCSQEFTRLTDNHRRRYCYKKISYFRVGFEESVLLCNDGLNTKPSIRIFSLIIILECCILGFWLKHVDVANLKAKRMPKK